MTKDNKTMGVNKFQLFNRTGYIIGRNFIYSYSITKDNKTMGVNKFQLFNRTSYIIGYEILSIHIL